MDARPILIGGLSHSGKTELRIALAAHPALALTRRTGLWDRYFGRFGALEQPEHLERCLAALMRDEAVRVLDPDPDRVRRELREGPPTYARLFGLLHAHHAERLGRRRWGEQLGFIERFADPIFDSYPGARMIHMVRDPRDRAGEASSDRRRRGSAGWETARWLRSAELARRNLARHPEGYRVVTYESLATRPEETLRQVCDFVGETCLPDMEDALRHIAFDRRDGASLASRDARVEAAFVDLVASQELPRFGYRPARPWMSAREQVVFALVDRPLNRATMTAWKALGRGRIARAVGG